MRKVLLTLLTVSTLLAFNACKKDGATGPAGPAGPTGAAGPAGAVGAAGVAGVPGAAGAAGSKILGLTVDPTTEGAVGDYAFNKTTKTLFGPKSATTGWTGTGTVLTGASGATGATGANGATGMNGATGATGVNGTKFLAGNGPASAVTAPNAVPGDFYFDKVTGVFYGPLQADGITWLNTMPLGSAYAAKTYNITRGFENVKGTKVYGSDLVNTYSGRNIFASADFALNDEDMYRMGLFPARADGSGGYSEDREMVFETSPGSNIWSVVAHAADNFGPSTQENAQIAANPAFLLPVPAYATPMPVPVVPLQGRSPLAAYIEAGAKFRYSHNSVNPMATFTLTQTDINRLKFAAGSAFGYWTHAKIDPTTLVALGQRPVLYDFKNIQIKNSTTKYYGAYTAQTKFNLDVLIPGLEKYKQEGKVFLKYRYYNVNSGPGIIPVTTNNQVINHDPLQAGWADITQYVMSYAKANGSATAGSTAYSTAGISDQNPFTLDNGRGSTSYGGAVLAANYPTTLRPLGSTLANSLITLEPFQTAQATVAGSSFLDGNVTINWSINSGINAPKATTPVFVGPTEFRNPFPNTDPNPIMTAYTAFSVWEAFIVPNQPTDYWVNRVGYPINTPLTTRNYYSSATLPTPTLTVTDNAGAPVAWELPNPGSDIVKIDLHRGGKPESYFENTKLVKVQVFVVPGDVIKELKAKGVDVNNYNEVSKFVKL